MIPKSGNAMSIMNIILIVLWIMSLMVLGIYDIMTHIFHTNIMQIEFEVAYGAILIIVILAGIVLFLYLVYKTYGNKGLTCLLFVLIILSLTGQSGLRGIYYHYFRNDRPYDALLHYDYRVDAVRNSNVVLDDWDYRDKELMRDFSYKEHKLQSWYDEEYYKIIKDKVEVRNMAKGKD